MEFRSTSGPLPDVPDYLTIPQFMFDYEHPNRPVRDSTVPWMIENDTGRQFFGEDIRERTLALANGLRIKYNFGEDDVALIFSKNHRDYPIMVWAVHMLGGIISGANPDFSVSELAHQIDTTRPALIVTVPECAETAAKAGHSAGIPLLERIVVFNVPSNSDVTHAATMTHVSVDELAKLGSDSERAFEERKLEPGEAKTKLAFLNFSSGTTGKPKAVAISHYSFIANIIQLAVHNKVNEEYCPWEARRFRPGDVVNGVLPLYHAYGIHINLHFCLFSAMTYVLFSKFNHVQMLEGIIRYRITHLMLVPPQIILLCKHPATERYDLSRQVRLIKSGAAPLAPEVHERLCRMFPEAHIVQGYGMTETCTINVMAGIEKKRGTPQAAGVLVPGVTIRVMKSDGSLAGYGEEGELVVKTPSVANGYFNNKQATDETFIDGWVRTGDIAKITKTGEVHVVDRLKEIMKVKGFQVAPAELEGCLLDHPDVSSACVVGVPDDFCGEIPLAFIALRTASAKRIACDRNAAQEIKASIMKHVADQKISYKHLAGGIEFLDAIPTSPSGKLLRRNLRERARAMRGGKDTVTNNPVPKWPGQTKSATF